MSPDGPRTITNFAAQPGRAAGRARSAQGAVAGGLTRAQQAGACPHERSASEAQARRHGAPSASMSGAPDPSRPALHCPRRTRSDVQAGTRPESRRADDLDLHQAVADIDDSIHRLGSQRLVPERFVCGQSHRGVHTQRTQAIFRRLRARGPTDRCPSPASWPGRTADQSDRGIGERSARSCAGTRSSPTMLAANRRCARWPQEPRGDWGPRYSGPG